MNKKHNVRAAKIALLLASSLTVMAGATIAPSLPQMSKVFADVPHAEFLSKLILTLPALFIALMAPATGWIIDRFGRLKLLGFSLVLYAAAGTTGLYFENLYMILAGRAALGIAVAGIMTTATTLIGDYFSQEERNKFLAMQGSFMALGGMVFVGTGGALADIGWRLPFSLYFFALALLPFVFFVLWEPQKEAMGTSQTHNTPPAPEHPRTVWLLYATGFVVMLLFYLIPVQLPFLLKGMGITQNTSAGIAIATTTLAGAIMSFFYRKFKPRLSYQAAYALPFILMAVGFTIVAVAQSYGMVLVGLAFSGLGSGWMMPNSSLWLLSIAPPAKRGRLVGGLTMAFFLGQFFSPILAEPIRKAWSLQAAFATGAGIILCLSLGYGLYAVWNRPKP